MSVVTGLSFITYKYSMTFGVTWHLTHKQVFISSVQFNSLLNSSL